MQAESNSSQTQVKKSQVNESLVKEKSWFWLQSNWIISPSQKILRNTIVQGLHYRIVFQSIKEFIPSYKYLRMRSTKVYTLGSHFRITKEFYKMDCSETLLHKENPVSSHFSIFPFDQKIDSIDFTKSTL